MERLKAIYLKVIMTVTQTSFIIFLKIFPKPNYQISKTMKHIYVRILKSHKNGKNVTFNAIFYGFLGNVLYIINSKMNTQNKYNV